MHPEEVFCLRVFFIIMMLITLFLFPILILAVLVLLGRRIRPSLRRPWFLLIIVMVGCVGADGLMLMLLPILGLSFGPFSAIFFFGLGRLMVLMTGLALLRIQPVQPWPTITLRLFAGIQLLLFCLGFYGMFIEPFQLGVTRLSVQSPAFFPDRPLRILQITDLHVERTTMRERDVLSKVAALQPDVIVLTGDYLNIDYRTDPESIADGHAFLAQLHAPYGVYAISGTPPVDLPEVLPGLFENTDIHYLKDASTSISFPGGTLAILGVSWKTEEADQLLGEMLSLVPTGAYTLLLYHAPDQINAASRAGIDLYLAGHTHGGQVRLPFYGALVTSSKFGKEYEMGQYLVGKTTLYVSRGVGMEGLTLPRIRFLAPPELVLVELGK